MPDLFFAPCCLALSLPYPFTRPWFPVLLGLVSLELDLVHRPHTVSEFEAHGKQTLDTDSAHYHFATAPGVTTDAQALIKSLKESDFAIKGECHTHVSDM
jgi:hypothetical protein